MEWSCRDDGWSMGEEIWKVKRNYVGVEAGEIEGQGDRLGRGGIGRYRVGGESVTTGLFGGSRGIKEVSATGGGEGKLKKIFGKIWKGNMHNGCQIKKVIFKEKEFMHNGCQIKKVIFKEKATTQALST